MADRDLNPQPDAGPPDADPATRRLPAPARVALFALLLALAAFYAGSFLYLRAESEDFILAERGRIAGTRPIPTGVWMEPGIDAAGRVTGWSASEPNGVWTLGRRAVWAGRPAPTPTGDLVLTVRAVPFLHATALPARAVTVLANGRTLARWDFALPAEVVERRATIPADLVADGGPLTLELRFDGTLSPARADGGQDRRELGLFVLGWSLQPG